MDFLFFIVHLIICIEIRSWEIMRLCFFTFYVKVSVRTFLRSENCHLPRFDLELAHPQHATHCLMRLKQPRVPITNSRAIRIPQCRTKLRFELEIYSNEELKSLNEFALYVISRYYQY